MDNDRCSLTVQVVPIELLSDGNVVLKLEQQRVLSHPQNPVIYLLHNISASRRSFIVGNEATREMTDALETHVDHDGKFKGNLTFPSYLENIIGKSLKINFKPFYF